MISTRPGLLPKSEEPDGRDHTSQSPASEVPSGEGSGCPTPLDWRQVVDAFCEQRERHEFPSDGRQTTFWTFGEGPPLYLLNGFFGDARLFALLAWLLREEQTCVMLDQWPTSADSSAADLRALSQHVLQAADSLGHQSFALHGTSFGSLVGLQMMRDAPERIERATLQAAFAARRLSLSERGLLSIASRSGRELGRLPLVASIQRQNHRRWFAPFDPTRWDFYLSQVNRTPVRHTAQLARIAGRSDLRSQLAQISTPVLLVQTEGEGRIITRAQEELARGLPDCTIESLDHSGSLPHVTHPHRLAKLLRAFRDGPEEPIAASPGRNSL